MNDATTRSSSAASGASVGSARATAASPACHSTPCGPMNGLELDDLPLRDEERAARALPLAGHDDAHGEPAQLLHAPDLARCLLERVDPVTEARGVLEAEIARKTLQLRAQLGQRVVERLPLDTLQRTRRELRPLAARQRPELGRLRGTDHAVAAPPEIEVPVGAHRPRIRRRPQLADQAELFERGLELGAEDAPFDPLERRRAPLRPPAAGGRSGSTNAAARGGRGHGRRRAPDRACRGRDRRRDAAGRRRRGRACAGRGAAWWRPARRDRRRCARRAPAPCRSAAAGSRPSPRRRAAPDGRAARRSRSGGRVRTGSRAGARAAVARARPCRRPSPRRACR